MSNPFQTRSKLRLFVEGFRPHLTLLIIDLACALGIALIDLSFPLLTRFGLNELLPSGRYRDFAWMIAMLALFFVLRSFMQYIVTYWGHLLGVRMEADLRRRLFAHLQTLPFSFYDRTRTGKLMSRVISDLFEITELAHHGPEDLFISAITLTGSLIVMFMIRWELALIILAMMPLIVFITVRARHRMAHASAQVKQRTASINADLENAISGIRVAKAFTNEDYEIEKFDHGNHNYREAKRGFYRTMASFASGMDFSTSTLNLLVIGAGGYFTVVGRMTLTDMLVFTLYVNTFLVPIRKLVAFFEQYSNGMAGFERYVELMATDPDIIDQPGAKPLELAGGAIRFSDVTFSYERGENVLEHIDLELRPGSTVALVGPSGGGKTTLCQLIPRFYDIQAGRIEIDGQDIESVTIESLRQAIGIVQQDVFLFAASIRENIRYGRVGASDEEVMEAARRAEIHDFIMSLPEGYDTEVGERGTRLSGGQKQRVSIARLFLRDPAILILDEATSALDTETELRIQSALEALAQGRTALIIAHRLSTVRNADHIVYIDAEGIREQGDHASLMRRDGLYRRLYEAQSGRPEELLSKLDPAS